MVDFFPLHFQAGRALYSLLCTSTHTSDGEQLKNESFMSASVNSTLECLDLLFKYDASFKYSWWKYDLYFFHCLFNNYLGFTISSLLVHDPKSEILYTEPVFKKKIFIVNYEKYIPKEVFLCCHPRILRACLAVSQCLNGCLIVVSELAVVSQGQGKVTLFFSKTALRKIFYGFISHSERKWSVV